jgi:rhodanese-related sulfurtransferase
MKRSVYVGVISFLIPFASMAQPTDEAAAPAVAAEEAAAPVETAAAPAVQGPQISCDEPNYDFGTVDNQNTIEHTFIIKNTGDTTLEITQVKPACGCTVAELTEKMVPPGGISHVTAKLALQGRSGLQSKSITIFSNDPQNPQYHVSINGTAAQSIQVTPDRLMFGQVGPGQTSELLIDVTGLGADAFTITGIEPSGSELAATSETVEEGKSYRLKVTLTGPTQVGPYNGNLRVNTSNPSRPLIDIPVIGNIVGEIVFAPSELAIPAQSDGSALTRYIVLRPGTLSSFEIKDVTMPDPAMKVSTFPFGDQGYRIQIENIITDYLMSAQKSYGTPFQMLALLAVAVLGAAVARPFYAKPLPFQYDWAGHVEGAAAEKGMRTATIEETRTISESFSHIIFDARRQSDYMAGHIPGAMSLPVHEVDKHLASASAMLTPAQPVLVYCSGQECEESLELGKILIESGYTNVTLFAGGITAWTQAGYPVER